MNVAMVTSTDLEGRIAAAFDDGAKSDDVARLIQEAEAAAVATGEAAERARARALDPTMLAADVATARREMEDAGFRRDRLQAAVTRLGVRLGELRAQEEDQRRRIAYEGAKVKRDKLASELASIYPSIERQLVDLFSRMETNDREVSYVNTHLPASAERLRFAELVARGIPSLIRNGTQIERMADLLALPAFKFSALNPLAWPQSR